MNVNYDISSEDLIERLRRAGSVWFKNEDLLLLEELIRRYKRSRQTREVQQS
jgi:hypothetical protein